MTLAAEKGQIEYCDTFHWSKKVLEVKTRSKTVNALLFYFVVVADKESLFNFKWFQLLQFPNDLAQKNTPLDT